MKFARYPSRPVRQPDSCAKYAGEKVNGRIARTPRRSAAKTHIGLSVIHWFERASREASVSSA